MATGSGSALFDYDNDGWLEAFLVNGIDIDKDGRPLSPAKRNSHHALFHNNGAGTFTKLTQRAGLAEPSYGQGGACGDFDGDGFTDLYVTNYGVNRLVRTRGDGSLEDATPRSGTGGSGGVWGAGTVLRGHVWGTRVGRVWGRVGDWMRGRGGQWGWETTPTGSSPGEGAGPAGEPQGHAWGG